MKKRIFVIATFAGTTLLLIGLLFGLVNKMPAFQNNSLSDDVKNAYDMWESLTIDLDRVENEYLVDDGFVGDNELPELLSRVQELAQLKVGSGVTATEKTEECVSIIFDTGIEYTFLPHRENVSSSGSDLAIRTYEPYWDASDPNHLRFEKDGESIIDAQAKYISDSISNIDFSPTNEYNDENVSIENLKNLSSNSLVLWFGHGTWSPFSNSQLATGTKITLETFSAYFEDMLAGRINPSNGRFLVTPKFFDFYYDPRSLDNSIFYLLACESLRDETLASTLVDKGASLVIGNTRSVYTMYGLNMFCTIFNKMTEVSEDTGRFYSAQEAIAFARNTYGAEDILPGHQTHHSEVAYWPTSSGDLRLKNIDDTSGHIELSHYMGQSSHELLSILPKNMQPCEDAVLGRGYSNPAVTFYSIKEEKASSDQSPIQFIQLTSLSMPYSSNYSLLGISLGQEQLPREKLSTAGWTARRVKTPLAPIGEWFINDNEDFAFGWVSDGGASTVMCISRSLIQQLEPEEENLSSSKKTEPTKKETSGVDQDFDLTTYLGKPCKELLAKIDSASPPPSDSEGNYRYQGSSVSLLAEKPAGQTTPLVSEVQITSSCPYSLEGIKFGMTMNEIESTLQARKWSISDRSEQTGRIWFEKNGCSYRVGFGYSAETNEVTYLFAQG